MPQQHPVVSDGQSQWQTCQDRGARRARPARHGLLLVARACTLAFLGTASSGCYTYRPIVGQAVPGMRVTMDINDRGRFALTDSLGGTIGRVEGTVQAATESTLVLRVASVQFLDGQVSKWSNESVTIRGDHARDIRERRFSRSRTALVTAGAVGAVVLFLASRSLLGFGSEGREIGPVPPGSEH